MDTRKLLRSLNAHKVRYVVIGAAAFPVHGYSRVTFDVDILIESHERNALQPIDALHDAGYDISVGDVLKKKILLRQYAVEADIHPHVKGASFPGVWARKRRGEDRSVFRQPERPH